MFVGLGLVPTRPGVVAHLIPLPPSAKTAVEGQLGRGADKHVMMKSRPLPGSHAKHGQRGSAQNRVGRGSGHDLQNAKLLFRSSIAALVERDDAGPVAYLPSPRFVVRATLSSLLQASEGGRPSGSPLSRAALIVWFPGKDGPTRRGDGGQQLSRRTAVKGLAFHPLRQKRCSNLTKTLIAIPFLLCLRSHVEIVAG